MEFKAFFNGEEILKGETVDLSKINTIPSEINNRYEVEIKLNDGTTITRYTDYIDYDDKNEVFHIQGVTFSGVDLVNVDAGTSIKMKR